MVELLGGRAAGSTVDCSIKGRELSEGHRSITCIGMYIHVRRTLQASQAPQPQRAELVDELRPLGSLLRPRQATPFLGFSPLVTH
jgi:hypothetical protein